MKIVKINTTPPELGEEPQPLAITQFIAARLFAKYSGAVLGKWDEKRGEGLWFYCRRATAMFDDVTVDEVIHRDPLRVRFRSVIFRLGSLAAERDGDLCGPLRLLPEDPTVDPGPERYYDVHASFQPKAGLWFRAAIVNVENAARPAGPAASL